MSMKNSSDTIGNRTRDPRACSAVPQPTASPHVPWLVAVAVQIMKAVSVPIRSSVISESVSALSVACNECWIRNDEDCRSNCRGVCCFCLGVRECEKCALLPTVWGKCVTVSEFG